eukprot:UN00005
MKKQDDECIHIYIVLIQNIFVGERNVVFASDFIQIVDLMNPTQCERYFRRLIPIMELLVHVRNDELGY